MYRYLCIAILLLTILPHHSVFGDVADADADDSVAGDDERQFLASCATQDYIVVGVGQSGSVIAGRLSENYTVLGIEAGVRTHRSLNGTDYVTSSFSTAPNGSIIVNTPFTRFDVPTFFPSTYTPPYPTVYKNFQAVRNGVLATVFVAKLLGGSGAHNGMLWSRLTKQNFDSWNVTGWSYNDVLPFYQKSENATGSRGEQFPAYHGFTGPIQISDVPTNQYYSSVPYFVQACMNTGLPNNTDFNGPSRLGCGTQQYNIRRGVRDSAANAYLPNALKTGRLTLALEAFANKIIFQKFRRGWRAVGVEYTQDNVTKRAYARKEIVVSLSAVLTPKLLQLSGIGNATLLQQYNIPVIVNNTNVGKNLGNNQITAGSWEYPNGTIPNGWRVAEFTQEYALNGTGVLSFPGAFGYAYACSKGNTCAQPDVMVGTTAGIFVPGTATPTISTNVEAAYPSTRGVVYIASADPTAPPIIDMPTFGSEEDLNATIYGFQLLRTIKNTYPGNLVFGAEIVPGPTVQTYEQYRNFVLTRGIPNAHYTGTCKVGNRGDPTAVVDPKMRVMGVRGLRVGDTSVVHRPNSHTQATSVMVGERAAAFMLAAASLF